MQYYTWRNIVSYRRVLGTSTCKIFFERRSGTPRPSELRVITRLHARLGGPRLRLCSTPRAALGPHAQPLRSLASHTRHPSTPGHTPAAPLHNVETEQLHAPSNSMLLHALLCQGTSSGYTHHRRKRCQVRTSIHARTRADDTCSHCRRAPHSSDPDGSRWHARVIEDWSRTLPPHAT